VPAEARLLVLAGDWVPACVALLLLLLLVLQYVLWSWQCEAQLQNSCLLSRIRGSSGVWVRLLLQAVCDHLQYTW
jgi:membrane-anchored protein YejM (alkaline phosphatase superfamily)